MMKKYTLVLVLMSVFMNSFSQETPTTEAKEVTTYYLINNAEKKEVTEEQKDPYLTDEGVERSKKWADVLSNVKLDAIYAINTISAKQTAQSVGESQKAGVYQFDDKAMYDASFKYLTNNKNILLVANNEITTKFANLVLGKEKYTLDKNDNFGRLFIVTVTEGSKIATVLKVD